MPRHLLVALLLLVPRLVEAQQDDDPAAVERARQLFGEGVGQHEARRYNEAVETFRAVLAIRAAPAVRYNLALNLFELGQYPEADAQVELLLTDPETPDALRESGVELRTNMQQRGGELRIEADVPENAEVKVDGYTVEDPNRPVRVISGTSHQVAVVVEGEAVASEVVSVGVGETEAVTLDTAEPSPSSSLEVDWGGASPVAKDWRFWAALGVVVAVGLVIVVATVVDDDDMGAVGAPLVSW